MLTPEQAGEQLKKYAVGSGKQGCLKRLAGFRAPIRDAAETILKSNEQASYYWGNVEDAGNRLALALDQASASERRKFFSAMFPAIDRHVERAWERTFQQPYEFGFSRRGFRAPTEMKVTSPRRGALLVQLFDALPDYEQDIVWLAAWAPHIQYQPAYSDVLAAAIDAGDAEGNQVFDVLTQVAAGTHEVGIMGNHVIATLLAQSRPQGWECIERMLLAAQREEGLRQSILEAVDQGHPTAFRRMLALILEHDLFRFSAVVRALDVWLGLQWDSDANKAVRTAIESAHRFLCDASARTEAIQSGDAETCYFALWASAIDDAPATIPTASSLLRDKNIERRYVALYLLKQLQLNYSAQAMVPALEDTDLRLAALAVDGIRHDAESLLKETDLFARVTRLLPRLPKTEQKLSPIVWPWCVHKVDRYLASSMLADAARHRSAREAAAFVDYMSPRDRGTLATEIGKQKKLDASSRAVLLQLVTDTASFARKDALEAMAMVALEPTEAAVIEAQLTRSAADLRQGILTLLLSQSDDATLASVDRLLSAGHSGQRRAGLELLQQLRDAGRAAGQVAQRIGALRAKPGRSEAERVDLEAFLGRTEAPPTLEDGLGLAAPAHRTKPEMPRKRICVLLTRAVPACIASLDELIHAHREERITLTTWNGANEEILLGAATHRFPRPWPKADDSETLEDFPMKAIWTAWCENRSSRERDSDGFELLRSLVALNHHLRSDLAARIPASGRILGALFGGQIKLPKLRYGEIASRVLTWLIASRPPPGMVEFLLDAVETSFARVPEKVLSASYDPERWDSQDWRDNWRDPEGYLIWLDLTREIRRLATDSWTPAHHVRLWKLLRWLDEPHPVAERKPPEWCETFEAYRAGAATDADIVDQWFAPFKKRNPRGYYYGSDLRAITARKSPPELDELPRLRSLVDRVRERILEIEVNRGDLATAASQPALKIQSLTGVDTLIRLIRGLGDLNLKRANWSAGDSKAGVLSHLIGVTFPGEDETPGTCAERLRQADIPDLRLVEVALLSPHWASHMEAALGWTGFDEAVWWIHAHTRDMRWTVEDVVRDQWKAEIAERTPLDSKDLLDGAVDVAWFHRVTQLIGSKRWKLVRDAAKYASRGTGHARAQLFADAMLGVLDRDAVLTRIVQKRHNDAVRALGLLPLAKEEDREADVLQRYEALQEFLRTGRQFGAQRRTSEKRAVEIGLENLARTAGYPDVLRLQWAMERVSLADLAAGPVTITEGDLSVTLSIDEAGAPEMVAFRKGKPLKSLPSAAKKASAAIGALQDRKTELRRQASRIRLSLEQSMCRGDGISGEELRGLFDHPMVRPLLTRVVFVGEGLMGYPVDAGRGLRDHAGRIEPLRSSEVLRIAHSHDLLRSGEWHLWQQGCFRAERIQPFKQVFRELYVLTATEASDGIQSKRYAGHQVNPTQALATLGSRGWVHRPDEGLLRTFHAEDVTAWINFENYFSTPAEVEGLTVSDVVFSRRGEWKPLPLSEVPPRVFSESMRDVDLMVSVAHRGGVDPEASASTVEMRASLVRETSTLLALQNVRLKPPHVLVDGILANYSVHLGSGVTHRQPGGHLCIVPVHAQHRGRLFLPFADDDPKSAEILSKVILLSQDDQIKDPTILQQLSRPV